MRSLSVVLAFTLAACTVGADDPGDDDDIDPTPGELRGSISSDRTVSGTVTLTADATVEDGATLTITAGTHLEAKMGTTLRVKGTLSVEGTAASKVTITPTADALTWAGFVVDAGGSATIAYAEGSHVATLLYCHAGTGGCVLDHVTFNDVGVALIADDDASILSSRIEKMSNGGISVTAGATTIRDTFLLTSSGDIVIQNGGSLTIDHSEIGEAAASYEHCDIHINNAAALTITRSNIRAAVYGIMIGGTTNAVMQYNNFVENEADKDISEVGINSGGDLRFNYWDQGAPALGAAFNTTSPSATRITDAGPRP